MKGWAWVPGKIWERVNANEKTRVKAKELGCSLELGITLGLRLGSGIRLRHRLELGILGPKINLGYLH